MTGFSHKKLMRNDTNASHMYFLYISIQLSFKLTIKFVGLILDHLSLIINLKIRYVKDVQEV
jgi:hypothetical protein